MKKVTLWPIGLNEKLLVHLVVLVLVLMLAGMVLAMGIIAVDRGERISEMEQRALKAEAQVVQLRQAGK